MENITLWSWRDLNTRWAELTEGFEGDFGKLLKIEGAGGKFFVAENTLKTLVAGEDE